MYILNVLQNFNKKEFLIVFARYFMAHLVSKHHYIIDFEKHFQFYAFLTWVELQVSTTLENQLRISPVQPSWRDLLEIRNVPNVKECRKVNFMEYIVVMSPRFIAKFKSPIDEDDNVYLPVYVFFCQERSSC